LAHWHRSEYGAAISAQKDALKIRSNSGDHRHIARCMNNLGITQLYSGDHPSSHHSFQTALSMFRDLGDRRGEAQALNNLGDLYLHMGERESARKSFAHSLKIFLEVGSQSERQSAN
jgi:tetratricopeptide (TPR) repeat protein